MLKCENAYIFNCREPRGVSYKVIKLKVIKLKVIKLKVGENESRISNIELRFMNDEVKE
jgi:hypothetical protein